MQEGSRSCVSAGWLVRRLAALFSIILYECVCISPEPSICAHIHYPSDSLARSHISLSPPPLLRVYYCATVLAQAVQVYTYTYSLVCVLYWVAKYNDVAARMI